MQPTFRSWPILALALACFAIGTTEFVIVGILPEVASDLEVSLSQAGLLVTGYAMGVALGGPLVVQLTARWPGKSVLLALLGVFIGGNALSALSPDYASLMTGRLVASLTHGSFFGIGAVIASDIAGPSRRGAAIALMFSGLTLATVLGVPLGTLIGQAAGWRSTFVAVSALGVLAFACVAWLLPSCPSTSTVGSAYVLAVMRRPRMWVALLLTIFSFGGVFAAFTFIAPMLVYVTGLTPHAAAGTLFLFGLGMTLGNAVGGRLADWKLLSSLVGILLFLTVVELGVSLALSVPALAVPMIFVWGFAAFCAVPGLQTNVVNEAQDAAAIASTLNVSAFNIGNAAGAWFGSLLVGAGLPLRLLPTYAAGIAAVAVVIAASAYFATLRVPSRAPIVPQHPKEYLHETKT